ncbi:MAG TPA: TPM domain-containing protein [Candidatus Brocadiaceae bacterium]|nr:TPM domain-containing protein [Candidatus Brocadiaceae bacterium]
MKTLKGFFTPNDEKRILTAICEAESRTSGEIRVRIERKAGKDTMALTRKAFESLGMRNTALHNGTLFVLFLEDKKFAILGDDGINKKVPDGFWNKVKDTVQEHFRKGLFTEGLVEGIKEIGVQLATFFPHQRQDKNELPDAISYATEGKPE